MISAELGWVVGERGLSGGGQRSAHVVAHRVGGVKRLSAELQTPLLTKREILAHPGIDVEHAVANDVVASP